MCWVARAWQCLAVGTGCSTLATSEPNNCCVGHGARRAHSRLPLRPLFFRSSVHSPSLSSSDVALAAKFTSLIIAPSVRGVCVRPSIRGLVWSSVRPSTSLASSVLSFLHFPQTGRPRPRAAQASILTCRNFSNKRFCIGINSHAQIDRRDWCTGLLI